MINFKDLFRFSQKEVSCLFKNATIKYSWRGLKLLQAPLDSFDSIHEADKLLSEHTSNNKFGKLLIITPGASGKAHQRNLFRRRVKDIFYTNKLYLHPTNSVLIAYKNAMIHDFDHLQEFLLKNIPPRVNKIQNNGKSATPKPIFTGACPCSTCGKNFAQPLKLWQRLFIATFDVIRPVFGLIGGACIYPVSCSDYAKHMIATKPFYKSIPLVILRVLSCNPITALFFRWKKNR
ncbi:MAG: membrane protein insertion efficiency factor YidD [Candidatus Babeliales bacterium]|jgi:ribonuclease P protein component